MDSIDRLIRAMTLEEKCSMLSGESFWYTQGIERLGIPHAMLTDGPNGLRKQNDKADHLGKNPSVPATCFPSGTALASTWNRELAFEMGQGLARECKAQDVAVILGPGVNIKRSPLCGRNFEYYSEDPFLASRVAAEFIRGIQSLGVGACLKHYAANNQETDRLTLDARVEERTLREIYLESFRYAVTEGKPWMVMSAYNSLNGTVGSENGRLLNDILRNEWGFDGVVVTDWGGVNDRVNGLKAGLDLEMPDSGGIFDRKVLLAVQNGELEEEVVDRAVRRILMLVQRYLDGKKKAAPLDLEENHRLAVRIGAEAAVLLKNEGNILPFRPGEKIAVLGEFAEKPRFQGGGSSHINPVHMTCALEEIRRFSPEAVYAKGFRIDDAEPDPALLEEALKAAEPFEKVVVFAGLSEKYETEGIDRTLLDLPDAQNRLIRELCERGKKVAVVLSNGGPVLMPWAERADGILEGYLLGQAGGEVLAKLLFGEINPSGKLAETFPMRLEDTPAFLDFPGHRHEVVYRENLFVGYRHYDARKIAPLFPFGFGLSYTSFEYADLRLDQSEIDENDTLRVTVKVRNTGRAAGKEIVELYVHDRQKTVCRPERELKGFAKVSLLPGEEKDVSFSLDRSAFSYYDEQYARWMIQSGTFEIQIGKSSAEIVLSSPVEVRSATSPVPRFTAGSSFGDIFQYPKTRKLAAKMMKYFQEESGIDFNLGDNIENFADTVVSSFPLRSLVTFTKGRFSEENLANLLSELNAMA